MTKTQIVFAGIVVVIGVAGAMRYMASKDTPVMVTTFEECIAAGNAVMESYPRQCRSADGTLFVEKVTPPTQIQEAAVRTLNIAPEAAITSPLMVEGEARGNWFFEASLPIRILDANRKEIAVAPAQAQGDWMTTDFVKFKTTLTFKKPTTPTGFLVIEKDNPSGLPENAGSYEIPVTFK